MKIVEIIASLVGLAIFATIGFYVIPYLLAFSGFMLATIIILALLNALWSAFKK